MNVHMKAPSQPGDAGFFWPTVGRPGRVPLWALAPDPEQPRKHFDPLELRHLADTMNPETGGEQREIATVRHLNAEEMDSGRFGRARYLIKSGERRWTALGIAGVPDIEIRVKDYPSKAKEKLDTWMLNGWRVGLSDIEDAYAIADIAKEHGWETQTEIGEHIHKDQVWVSQRMALLKTTPAVQKRLLPCDNQYTLAVGVFFSRLAPEKQDQFVRDMPPECKTAASQINWMVEQLRKEGLQLPTRNREPRMIRRALNNLTSLVGQKIEGFRLASDFDHLFEHASRAQRIELVNQVRNTARTLYELANRVEALAEATGKLPPASVPRPPLPAAKAPTPSVERVAEVKAPPPRFEKPVAVARPQPVPERRAYVPPPVRQPTTLPAPRPKDPGTVQVTGTRASAPAVVRSGRPEWKNGTVKVKRWYERYGEFRIDIPDLRDYIKLWDEGALEFQRTGASKPDDIPHRDEVAEFLGLDDE